MINYGRIKALQLGRKKEFRLLLAVEIIILIISIAGLFGKNKIYEYGVDQINCNIGTYSETYQGYLADDTMGAVGSVGDFTQITLPKGTYNVQLQYVTDTDMENWCEVTSASLTEKNLRTNGAQLFSGRNSTNFDMWLLRDATDLTVQAHYDGTGMLAIQGLVIEETNAWNRIQVFCILVFSMLINSVYCYIQYDKAYQIPVKSKNVVFALGMIILFASIPFTLDYVRSAGDLGYHLMRVEGIKDGLLNGQFPIRISPEWLQGYGYASPIFYGETILYIAAMFRLIGFSVTTSYNLFMFVIATATVLIAYECFRKIFKDEYIGVLCSMIYSLSVYRIYKTYYCGSWGETLGIMILPIILYGFYRVFTQDISEESYKRSWLPLTIGFTLLVQSHLLSGEMVGLFTIILCVVLWKKVFRPQTFLVLAKTVIYSVLLSAWFLVPFVDYMMTGDFVIHHVSGRTIQYRGLYPAHLLFTYFGSGDTVFFDEQGMYDSAAMGLGIAPVMALFLLCYLFFAGKTKEWSREDVAFGKITAVFSAIAMVMSLSLFPWDRIQALNDVTATLVSSIQFPNRFLTIANVGLTAVAGLVAKHVMSQKNRMMTFCYIGGMIFLTAASGIYLQDDIMNRAWATRIFNSEGMGTGYIAGAEYLPYKVNSSLLMYHDPKSSGQLEIEDYEKLSLGAKATIRNTGNTSESVAFSLLYYKGYQACDADSGERMNCYAGENHEVTVDIPSGFEGTVKVSFVSPWYWRLGEGITLVTFVVMLVFFRWKSRKKNGKERQGERILEAEC